MAIERSKTVCAELADESVHFMLRYGTTDGDLQPVPPPVVGDVAGLRHHPTATRAVLKRALARTLGELVRTHVGVGVHFREDVLAFLVSRVPHRYEVDSADRCQVPFDQVCVARVLGKPLCARLGDGRGLGDQGRALSQLAGAVTSPPHKALCNHAVP